MFASVWRTLGQNAVLLVSEWLLGYPPSFGDCRGTPVDLCKQFMWTLISMNKEINEHIRGENFIQGGWVYLS